MIGIAVIGSGGTESGAFNIRVRQDFGGQAGGLERLNLSFPGLLSFCAVRLWRISPTGKESRSFGNHLQSTVTP
jgi:hypothetical protein